MFTIGIIRFPNISLFTPARKPPLAQIWSKTAIKEYIVKGALLHGGLFCTQHRSPFLLLTVAKHDKANNKQLSFS